MAPGGGGQKARPHQSMTEGAGTADLEKRMLRKYCLHKFEGLSIERGSDLSL